MPHQGLERLSGKNIRLLFTAKRARTVNSPKLSGLLMVVLLHSGRLGYSLFCIEGKCHHLGVLFWEQGQTDCCYIYVMWRTLYIC